MGTFPVVDADPGVTRQVLSEHPQLMMIAFVFNDGAHGKLHHHPHIQSIFVQSGKLAFSSGGAETIMSSGNNLVIPSNAEHGCKCIEAGTLIDSFTLRRDDFL